MAFISTIQCQGIKLQRLNPWARLLDKLWTSARTYGQGTHALGHSLDVPLALLKVWAMDSSGMPRARLGHASGILWNPQDDPQTPLGHPSGTAHARGSTTCLPRPCCALSAYVIISAPVYKPQQLWIASPKLDIA